MGAIRIEADGTTSTGMPSSTTGAEDEGAGLGPGVGEGEAAGVAEARRTVAGGDDDGDGLAVVLPQAATSAVTSATARSRRILAGDSHEIGWVCVSCTARKPRRRRTRRMTTFS
jgi:hypothetical protein